MALPWEPVQPNDTMAASLNKINSNFDQFANGVESAINTQNQLYDESIFNQLMFLGFVS